MHWRIELFIILSFMSASFSLIFLFVYLSVLYRQYPIHINKLDILFHVIFSSIIGAWSLFVLETAFYYRRFYPTWDSIQVFDSCFAGMAISMSYLFGLIVLTRKLRGAGQFRRTILQEEAVNEEAPKLEELPNNENNVENENSSRASSAL